MIKIYTFQAMSDSSFLSTNIYWQLIVCFIELQALIVLEYLAANGAERVIDEIKDHAHQILVLSYPLSFYCIL